MIKRAYQKTEAINLNPITLLGTIIQLSMTALETGLGGGMSDPIRYLNVSFLLPIGFEIEWHSS